MVITKLFGGLGNQMFQYAAGRSLAERFNTNLKLDVSRFKYLLGRRYALDAFCISGKFAHPREVYAFTGRPQTLWHKSTYKIGRMLFANLPFFVRFKGSNPCVYLEPHFHFSLDFLRLKNNVYLEGYWQSEKYFENIEKIIRREFVVREPLVGKNLEIADQIQSCESVSVHIRRGDYVTDPIVARYHGVCSLSYYRLARTKMAEVLTQPHFFFFSDDPGFVKRRFPPSQNVTIVEHNGREAPHEDLRLMALCNHNVTANSSFSWWAAWLNQNKKKVVIAPKKWFEDERMRTRCMSDLYPDGWILL